MLPTHLRRKEIYDAHVKLEEEHVRIFWVRLEMEVYGSIIYYLNIDQLNYK